MPTSTYTVPGVYGEPRPRAETLPRLRTDVVGFVGAAGPRRLHDAVALEDWRSYVQTFLRDERGAEITAPAGSRLADSVFAYFANGGARCWIVNVASSLDDPSRVLDATLGIAGGELAGRRHGLELLLTIAEVSLVVLPELDATLETDVPRNEALPPLLPESRFGPCRYFGGGPASGMEPPSRVESRALYTPEESLFAQRFALSRIQRERWRWFLLLAPPTGTEANGAVRWAEDLRSKTAAEACDCAALYWPGLRFASGTGAAEVRSPLGCVAGVFARRDLALGPHVAPANERVLGVVGTEHEVDDESNARLYEAGVNVLRPRPGRGIVVWGARTLRWQGMERSVSDPLAYVNGRRCLSAIERTAEQVAQPLVFEPHRPLLRAQLAQSLLGYLLSVRESGALKGIDAESSFFVRCDATNNPRESVERGELHCDVGVALAAPAEFLVFRLGRSEGVTEIVEEV